MRNRRVTWMASFFISLLAAGGSFGVMPEVSGKESSFSATAVQQVKTTNSAYARALILINLADMNLGEGRNSKAGSLLDEAGRAAEKIPDEQGQIASYIQWLKEQLPKDREAGDISVDEDYIPESLRNMQADVWERIAVRYVKLGSGEKALRAAERMDGEARDEVYVQLGKLFLEANRKDMAGRVESRIKGITQQVKIKDAFVHWLIRRGDFKAAALRLKEMVIVAEAMGSSEQNRWREEWAIDYAALGDDLQALAQIEAITSFRARNSAFLSLAAFQKEKGRFVRLEETLGLAVMDAAKAEDAHLLREAVAGITRQAGMDLPNDQFLTWFQKTCETAKAIPFENRGFYLYELADGIKSLANKQPALSALEQAVQSTSEMSDTKLKVELSTEMGDLFNELGQTAEAAQVWVKTVGMAAKLDAEPDYKANSFGRLVRRIAIYGDPGKAFKLIEGKKSAYDRSIALAEVARGYLELNKFDEALPVIRQIPNAYRRAILLKEAAARYREAGKAAAGIPLLDEALREVSEAQDPLLKMQEELDIAREYCRAGEFGKGEAAFESIPDASFRQDNGLKMAEELLRSNQSERVIRFIEKTIPDNEWFFDYCILSGTSFELELIPMKNALFERALGIARECEDAEAKDGMLGLGAMYYLVYDESEKAAETISAISTAEIKRETSRRLGQYYLKNGRPEKAWEIAGQWKLEALGELAAIRLAQKYAQEGRTEEALRSVFSLKWDLTKGEAFQVVFGKQEKTASDGMFLDMLEFIATED